MRTAGGEQSMSVAIETIVLCDNCGHQNSGDDRNLSARQIRKSRGLCGWIQRGSKDYCEQCAPKFKKRNKV